MTYYLGRDVHASITTEHETCGIRVHKGATYIDNVMIAGATSVAHGAVGSATNRIVTAAHGLSQGDPITCLMDDDTALTGGLTENTTFYAVIGTDANGADSNTSLKLASTYDNAIGFVDTTMNTTSGDATVTHDNVNTPVVGMNVSGNGIPAGAYVDSINSATSFELQTNATVSATDVSIRFSTIVPFANNTQIGKFNIVRLLKGTSDTAYAEDSTQPTFIFNREYPTFKVADTADGGIAAIYADDTASNAVPLQFSTAVDRNRISDLVGIDLALDKVDEDINYFGQRTSLKAEIKQGISVTFTRKKSDQRFNVLAKTARCGIKSFTTTGKTAFDVDSATASASNTFPAAGTLEIEKGDTQGNALTQLHPINQNWGYRVHVQLKGTEEIIAIRNACISEYSVTPSADGVTEESITFYSNVEPIYDDAPYATVTASGDI